VRCVSVAGPCYRSHLHPSAQGNHTPAV